MRYEYRTGAPSANTFPILHREHALANPERKDIIGDSLSAVHRLVKYEFSLLSPCSCKITARSFVHVVEQIDGLCRPSLLDTAVFLHCMWVYKPYDDTQMNRLQISRRLLNNSLVKVNSSAI
jgi:hypothetical protein